ncbi:MAG: hypothetical protein L0Z54_04985 [Thermoplasmata archaeon]|nr:hypothetical protein [Thermoplasmata archaeon]
MPLNPWRRLRSERLYRAYLPLARRLAWLRYRRLSKAAAIHVMEEEWDYLIVLDACRLDAFRQHVTPVAGSAVSGGSATQEWAEWNFDGRFEDTIYVAGNPHFARSRLTCTFGHVPFHHVVDVWDFGWDETVRTVPPAKVTDAALDALRRFPDRRMIVHYNQPHHPFLSDPSLLDYDEGTAHEIGTPAYGNGSPRAPGEEVWPKKRDIYLAVRMGQVDLHRAWKGYRSNLDIVWREVLRLSDALDGKVVVTADHGEALGEMMLYGHPHRMRIPALVLVPWHVLKDVERGPASVGRPGGDGPVSEMAHIDDTIRRLKDLGKV